MINRQDLYPLGLLGKPHGYKGEIKLLLEDDPEIMDLSKLRFMIIPVEGLPVPFEVEELRGKSTEYRIVRLKGVDEKFASTMAGMPVYITKHEAREVFDGLDDDNLCSSHDADGDMDGNIYLDRDELLNYRVVNEDDSALGRIVDFNDQTINLLITVLTHQDDEILIPFVEEWIIEVDPEKKTIKMQLPEGLI